MREKMNDYFGKVRMKKKCRKEMDNKGQDKIR